MNQYHLGFKYIHCEVFCFLFFFLVIVIHDLFIVSSLISLGRDANVYFQHCNYLTFSLLNVCARFSCRILISLFRFACILGMGNGLRVNTICLIQWGSGKLNLFKFV